MSPRTGGSSRWGSAFCNHAVPVVQRDDLARSVVARHAGRRALDLAGVDVEAVDHLDLYSCFPAAVQVAAGELGIPLDRQLTVTGGMTFAGGPLNSYVLHSTASMADVLRADPGSAGLVTSVSGFLTKYGAGVWSTTPAPDGWRSEDVTAEAKAADTPRPDTDDPGDDVRVVAGTVVHDREGGRTAIDVVETADGTRSLPGAEQRVQEVVDDAGAVVRGRRPRRRPGARRSARWRTPTGSDGDPACRPSGSRGRRRRGPGGRCRR